MHEGCPKCKRWSGRAPERGRSNGSQTSPVESHRPKSISGIARLQQHPSEDTEEGDRGTWRARKGIGWRGRDSRVRDSCGAGGKANAPARLALPAQDRRHLILHVPASCCIELLARFHAAKLNMLGLPYRRGYCSTVHSTRPTLLDHACSMMSRWMTAYNGR